MKKLEIRRLIRKMAFEFASSGKYSDWLSIEVALKKEGFPEARQELDNTTMRKELDELCNQSKMKSNGDG